MRRRSIPQAVIATAVALGAAGCSGGAVTDPEQGVLSLELASCTTGITNRATAIAVGDGLALTVAHAFVDVDGFSAIDADGQTIAADVIDLDIDNDIAVLRLGEDPPTTLTLLAVAEAPAIEFLTYRSEAGPARQEASVLRFVGVSLDGTGSRDGIELAADVQSGDSGGPVVDDQGRVIGMVFATARDGERGWATASSELQRAADEADLNGPAIDLNCQ